MTSVCISNCVNDAHDPRVPVRATYVNLHKWPESEAEFVRSHHRRVGGGGGGGVHGHPRVVDSISCRQLYLRSYPFTKEEPSEKIKCFRMKVVKDDDGNDDERKMKKKKKKKRGKAGKKKHLMFRKVKDSSCSALFRFFHKLLSCSASVDVSDQKD